MRLDLLVVARGLAESRAKAQALILTGAIKVNNETCRRPGESLLLDASIDLVESLPYVSRGGYKLAHALDAFAIDPTGMTALDVGASTGGFTDVLLQRGAAAVYAVDVGYGILDYRIRSDARVIVLERTNIRYLTELPPAPHARVPPQGAVIDVAFISLRLVLPAVKDLLHADGWIIALIKPQFEAGVNQVGRGGVVRDPAVRMQTVVDVLSAAEQLGYGCAGLERSPIIGPAGNVEFLALLRQNVATDVASLCRAVDFA
jgi:23S rRNA (cytidine1920-2'-O)/16S rRNA (cytidine1409-2'-O)-methyltransferase